MNMSRSFFSLSVAVVATLAVVIGVAGLARAANPVLEGDWPLREASGTTVSDVLGQRLHRHDERHRPQPIGRRVRKLLQLHRLAVRRGIQHLRQLPHRHGNRHNERMDQAAQFLVQQPTHTC